MIKILVREPEILSTNMNDGTVTCKISESCIKVVDIDAIERMWHVYCYDLPDGERSPALGEYLLEQIGEK